MGFHSYSGTVSSLTGSDFPLRPSARALLNASDKATSAESSTNALRDHIVICFFLRLPLSQTEVFSPAIYTILKIFYGLKYRSTTCAIHIVLLVYAGLEERSGSKRLYVRERNVCCSFHLSKTISGCNFLTHITFSASVLHFHYSLT
jgi:hypothetical protein